MSDTKRSWSKEKMLQLMAGVLGKAGNITGPSSATNNRIALFDGTTGKNIKQSSYTAGAAAAKGVDTSIASGSTSSNLPTSAAVASLIGSEFDSLYGLTVAQLTSK